MAAVDVERVLSAARPETLERELMRLALTATGARHGALFLWDRKARGLVLAHHVVEGVTVTLPDQVLTPGGKAGIAMWTFEHGEPYLCRDTTRDPSYTRYRAAAAAGVDAVTMYRLLRKRGVTVRREPRTTD